MENVKYNLEFFDVLRDLVSVSNSIVIKKEDDKIVVRKADSDVTIAYSLKAPTEYFDFPANNDDVSFYNYGEFYQYLKSFGSPEILIDNKKVTLKENTSKIDYILSNPESFEKKTPKEPKFDESDISFDLTPADHDEIIKMITLIKPKKARIVGNSKQVQIIIFNQLHENSFEKVFDVKSSNGEQEVDFLIFSDTFLHIPSKREYTFNIKTSGFVKISLLNNPMSLDIFTGKVKQN